MTELALPADFYPLASLEAGARAFEHVLEASVTRRPSTFAVRLTPIAGAPDRCVAEFLNFVLAHATVTGSGRSLP